MLNNLIGPQRTYSWPSLSDFDYILQPILADLITESDKAVRAVHSCKSVCVCSNSRILVTTFPEWLSSTEPCRASVLVVFVVFCVHVYSFAGLIRRTPPPMFSDTAITDRHSDTTIFQLRAHWVRISWSTGSEKSFGYVPSVGVEPSTSCVQSEHPIH